jgi:hypothetical protein
LKVGVKKTRKRTLDQSEAEKLKKVVFETKTFHKTLVAVCGSGRREVGGWAVRRGKSVRTVGWVGRSVGRL